MVLTLNGLSESPEGTNQDSGPPFPISASRGLWMLSGPARYSDTHLGLKTAGLITRYLHQMEQTHQSESYGCETGAVGTWM